ncbi:UDP-glucuronic acid decarboxylase family protein [Yinghuangia seranimata]|uniref:UDP-glucuronic acid decarboxylase family protein n=1 Tax=Yinghuangia seranimata TaxID=408067 RepID=UPI00248AB608|nr:UDP-glucuronic acid decarboxylase family protein [Yinghuangia seranimata]MDI2124570.1 SDR family oxidoreductase [Yinghuangia seranimata]
MRKRVVVTGGAGFIGSHLCERLIADGYSVLCADNLLTSSLDNLAGLAGEPGFEFLEQDVSDGLAVSGKVAIVLHFASPASPVDYARHPLETLRVGSVGTMNCLELAREKNARFLIASTSEVYGDPAEHPQRESYWGNVNPIGPRACYDEAKRFSEAAAATYRSLGTDAAIIRIFNTFGPRMRPADGRAIPTFIRQLLDGEPLTVAGDGSQTRSFCYVDDLVDGIVRMARSNVPGPVNLGNPTELTILDLAHRIRELAESAVEIRHVPLPVDDPRVRRPDIGLALELLDWRPVTPFEQALSQTFAWCSAHWAPAAHTAGPATAGVPVAAPVAANAATPVLAS